MQLQRVKELIITFGVIGTVGAACTLIGSAYILVGTVTFGAVKISEFIKILVLHPYHGHL